ncbi:MAG: RagB/SusD family nutrient uptake outer membrane protein [Chloroflexia bacterium]|nr:RagB/SusD family nutrient uptake outer membrane protein [Chloroflexia bacterium]
MYAEAKIELNQIDQSVIDAINEVRGRVNMPNVSIQSQSIMREILRRERRVELAFEGLRLLDIRRWKIAEDVMPGVPEVLRYTNGHPDPNGTPIVQIEERYFDPAKDYLWPIPQSEIDISKLEQNPKW